MSIQDKPDLGYHIFMDLHGCKKNMKTDTKTEQLTKIRALIHDAGLNTLRDNWHIFDNGSYTYVCLLSESHVSVHTWPERKTVHIDIFVCNYSEDNSGKARYLSRLLEEFFDCAEFMSKAVHRSG